MPPAEIPEFRDWSIAAVRLLQGAVDSDDEQTWSILLSSQLQLEAYFARIGLLLVVDEPEGLAYVRQLTEDECPGDYDRIPKLFRRTPLGYGATLLCVLLREELRRFEEEEVDNERCVVESSQLFDEWKTFFPAAHDEVRQHREFSAAVRKLEDLGFVRKFGDPPEAWEVRRILKARLPVSELEGLKAQLIEAAERAADSEQTSTF